MDRDLRSAASHAILIGCRALVCAAGLGSAAQAAIPETMSKPTQHALASVVAHALIERAGIPAFGVAVQACPDRRGYVRLTGAVDTRPQRRRALEAALDVRGVVAVIDQIFVVDVLPIPGTSVFSSHIGGDVPVGWPPLAQ
jgi:osmotically-inducible protein OsmY